MSEPIREILPDQPRLAGRRIIVTGAASGMGKAIAQVFAAQGAALTLLDVQADSLIAVAQQVAGTPVVANMADPVQVAGAVDQALAAMGGIDGLVNAAGILRIAPLEETTLDTWNEVQAVNLVGPFLLANAAVPHMRVAGQGTIVNIASMGGIFTPGRMAAYGVSKAGLIALTKGQATEWAPVVRSNAIAPGFTRTPMTDALVPGSGASPRGIALAREGTPLEMAYLALFLTSRESAFVNGATYEINGGAAS